MEVCFALGDWGAKWLDVAPEQLDSHVVLWSMARLLDRNQLPTDRVVIRFDLTDLERKNRFWMVLERDHTEVCLKNPGYPEQLLVTTTSEWLAKWAHGLDLDAAGARPGPDHGRGPTQAHPSHRDLGTEPLPGHPPSQPPDRATPSQRPLTSAPRPEPAPRTQADGYADHRPGRDLAARCRPAPSGLALA